MPPSQVPATPGLLARLRYYATFVVAAICFIVLGIPLIPLAIILRALFGVTDLIYPFGKFGARCYLMTAGARVRAFGYENISPDKPYVFVSNHQSIYDIPVIFWSLNYQIRIIAKESLARFPVLGWHLKRGGHLWFRGGHGQDQSLLLHRGGAHLPGIPLGQRALLLLGLEDVHRPLVARQQVGAVVGGEEVRQGLHPRHDADEVVVAQGEDRVHQVVALALIAQGHLQAIGQEVQDFGGDLREGAERVADLPFRRVSGRGAAVEADVEVDLPADAGRLLTVAERDRHRFIRVPGALDGRNRQRVTVTDVYFDTPVDRLVDIRMIRPGNPTPPWPNRFDQFQFTNIHLDHQGTPLRTLIFLDAQDATHAPTNFTFTNLSINNTRVTASTTSLLSSILSVRAPAASPTFN